MAAVVRQGQSVPCQEPAAMIEGELTTGYPAHLHPPFGYAIMSATHPEQALQLLSYGCRGKAEHVRLKTFNNHGAHPY